MTPALLLDENFPWLSVEILRATGFDVLAISEQRPGAPDAEVLEIACRTGRWLVTFDRDHGELVFRQALPPPPAVLYFRQEPVPASLPAHRLIELLSDWQPFEGFLSVVTVDGVRKRPLPLRPA